LLQSFKEVTAKISIKICPFMEEWEMKNCFKNLFVVIAAYLLTAGVTLAQVGPDGNLTYTLSNTQQGNQAASKLDQLIVRNRMDTGNTWTASAEAMFMTRSGGKSATLVQDGLGTELLNTNGINFPWSAGERVSIVGEDICCGLDFEASFFDIGWLSNSDLITPDTDGSLMVFNLPQFNLVAGDAVNFRYLSQLRSAEINLRHPFLERFSVLGGFRYMELHEDLRATISDVEAFDANVDNHLYGGQIGLNAAIINTCRFSLEGVLKAGVFANYADLTMPVRDMGRFGDKTTHTAVFGEIGLMGIFQVTQCLAIKGGYQVMWLDGIALAGDQPENVDPTNPKPYMGGTLLMHGATAGIEYAF
jgi:hypothetical protein